MILIFSNKEDRDSQSVIDWLRFLAKDFALIGGIRDETGAKTFVSIRNFSSLLKYRDTEIHTSDIQSVWFRKSAQQHISESELFMENTDYLNLELNTYMDSVKLFLEEKIDSVLGSHQNGILNKFRVCNYAQSLDLKIPESILTNCTKEAQRFVSEVEGNSIIKAISDTHTFESKGKVYTSYTSHLIMSDLDDVDLHQFPILCQRYIPKEFEIRSFFLDGEFYSMAIFSQMDDTGSVDFRASQQKSEVRRVPFELPDSLKNKLEIGRAHV